MTVHPEHIEASLKASSDSDLIRLSITGQQMAFRELVYRHATALRTQLRRMGAQGADADDMAQEAFITAYENLNDYRFEGPFIGWLKRIAIRKYLKKIKASERYLWVEDMRDYDKPSQDLTFHNSPSLDHALGALKPIERICISLNFNAEMTHQEISDELNLPLGTVKSHLKRALERLRHSLSPHGEESVK